MPDHGSDTATSVAPITRVCPDCRTALRGQPAGCPNDFHARLNDPKVWAEWQALASAALSDKDWNALVLTLARKISDEAAVWEEDFQGQPGLVVGVMDAAVVAARYCAEHGLGCAPDCADDTHGHPLPEDRVAAFPPPNPFRPRHGSGRDT